MRVRCRTGGDVMHGLALQSVEGSECEFRYIDAASRVCPRIQAMPILNVFKCDVALTQHFG
jgi:hypothetical protein